MNLSFYWLGVGVVFTLVGRNGDAMRTLGPIFIGLGIGTLIAQWVLA